MQALVLKFAVVVTVAHQSMYQYVSQLRKTFAETKLTDNDYNLMVTYINELSLARTERVFHRRQHTPILHLQFFKQNRRTKNILEDLSHVKWEYVKGTGVLMKKRF